MSFLTALLAGLLFGCGIVISGMTVPAKVIGFLDVSGDWDPSLIFVMGAALLVYAPLFRLIVRRKWPLAAESFELPKAQHLDARLIGGAALFGVGWGLAGLCPAPALVTAGALLPGALVFVVAMVAGASTLQFLDGWRKQRAERRDTLRADA